MTERLNRRAALARLGLGAAAAYMAPAVLTLSEARASHAGSASGNSRGSGWRRGARGSRPSGPSRWSRPSGPSGRWRPSGPSGRWRRDDRPRWTGDDRFAPRREPFASPLTRFRTDRPGRFE